MVIKEKIDFYTSIPGVWITVGADAVSRPRPAAGVKVLNLGCQS